MADRRIFGAVARVAMPMAALVVALAGCGDGTPPPTTLRPVLVGHADGAQTATPAGVVAFAGEIRAREETALAFRVGGKLVRRLVDVGDRVRRGDVLAELDPGDLQLQAQGLDAQAVAADAQLARARADHARFAALAKDQLVSRSTLDQATAALRAAEGQARAARAQRDLARNQAAYSQLRAPQDGAISSRQIEAGQVVAAGQPVFGLAADAGREIAFALPEAGIRGFAVGQPVRIELWSAPGRPLSGRIREIAPAADPQTRTYAARATIDGDAATTVDLGQSARVYIATAAAGAPASLHLPLSALQRDDRGATAVWVVDAASRKAHRLPVSVGPYAADGVAVLSGLRSDAWVVLAGGHLLREGETVLPVDRTNRPIPAK